jgi:hypothetical protein
MEDPATGTDRPHQGRVHQPDARDPNLIKRPVIVTGKAVTFGFNPDSLEHNIVSYGWIKKWGV